MFLERYKKYSYVVLFLYWLGINYLVFHAQLAFFDIPTAASSGDQFSTVALTDFQATPVATMADALSGDLQGQRVTLPDDWSQHSDSSSIWVYQAQLPVYHHSEEQLAVYLPSVTHNAVVYINDIWIGQGGKMEDPVSRHHNDPLLFTFSSALLNASSNQLKLIVKAAYYQQGLLDKVYFGENQALSKAYEWKHFLRVDFIRWVTVAMYVMSVLLLVFWVSRPRDVIYGIFSLELFFWATHNLNLFVSEIPVSSRIWEAMIMSTLGWTVIAMIYFNHRYIGYGYRWVENIILLFAIAGIGIFFLPTIGSILTVGYGVWDSFLLVVGSYAIIHLLIAYYKKTHVDAYLMLVAGLPILVFGLHDILLVNHFLDRRDGLIIQYSVIPASILFTWFLVRRFVTSLNKAENLTQTLEARVEEKQRAIHAQYEQLKVLEKESVLAEERERIMRDMHDGIGGQLVSTLVLLQNYQGEVYDKIRNRVQHSLTDLRFVIDSLDPLLSDIPTLLGMMRMRLMDQLQSADIELEWAVTELPEVPNMTPRRCLHIMRIIQEAINNCIKHSGATKIRLETGVLDDDRCYIDVCDFAEEAQGIDTETTAPAGEDMKCNGRGIDNMKHRAQQLEGELHVMNQDEGLTVRLIIPCV